MFMGECDKKIFRNYKTKKNEQANQILHNPGPFP